RFFFFGGSCGRAGSGPAAGTSRAALSGWEELPCTARAPDGVIWRTGGCEVSQLATWVPPPPCNWHVSTGCVPSMQYSVRTLGHPAVANWPDNGSICVLTIPAGAPNSETFRYS